MWILNNDTPFLAEQTFLSDRDGRDTYVVVLKATFDIGPDGQCRPALIQQPIDHAPRPLVPGTPSSLAAETDFDFMKPGTDVIVHGSAVNTGRPQDPIMVGLKVGPIEKRVLVTGPRIWLHSFAGPILSDPEPFLEMPLIWENAFGGPDRGVEGAPYDARNPVGTGHASSPDGIEGQRAPTIFQPGGGYERWSDRPAPAGFGPIARHWSPRAGRAGTYDKTWQDTRAPLWALDLDMRFFMAAPDDQQVIPPLVGNEEVRLINMTKGGHLAFRLPPFRPYGNVMIGRERLQIRLRLGTLTILPTTGQVVESWIGSLGCQGRREQIRSTDLWDKPLVRMVAGVAQTADEDDA